MEKSIPIGNKFWITLGQSAQQEVPLYFSRSMELTSRYPPRSGFSSVVPEIKTKYYRLCQNFYRKKPYSHFFEKYLNSHQNQSTSEIGTDFLCVMSMAAFREIKIQVILIDLVQHFTFTVDAVSMAK